MGSGSVWNWILGLSRILVGEDDMSNTYCIFSYHKILFDLDREQLKLFETFVNIFAFFLTSLSVIS